MQGIKFYDPEIVGDTPETVEFRGLQNLVHVLREHVGLRAGKLIFAPDGSVRLIIPLYPKDPSLHQGCNSNIKPPATFS